MPPAPVIRLHPDDGVLIARASLPPGLVVAEFSMLYLDVIDDQGQDLEQP